MEILTREISKIAIQKLICYDKFEHFHDEMDHLFFFQKEAFRSERVNNKFTKEKKKFEKSEKPSCT